MARKRQEPLPLSLQQEKKNDETFASPHASNQQQEKDGVYQDVAPPSQASNAIGLRVLARTPIKDAVNNYYAADDNDTNNARSSPQTPFDEAATTTPVKKKPPSSPITPQSHRITVSTISSNPSPLKHANVDKRIQEQQITTEQGSGGILNDIIEDVEFCGMTLCNDLLGIRNTAPVKEDISNAPEKEHKIDKPIEKQETDDKFLNDDSDHIKMQEVAPTMNDEDRIDKEKRMKEMDDTFLGKMIQCVDIDDKCGAVDDSIL